jgi:hypothetical protein
MDANIHYVKQIIIFKDDNNYQYYILTKLTDYLTMLKSAQMPYTETSVSNN